MITSLIKVALLSVGACNNAVLSTPKGKYTTNTQPTYDIQRSLLQEDVEVYMMSAELEPADPENQYTTSLYATEVISKTYSEISLKVETILLTAYQTTQIGSSNLGSIVNTISRRPFELCLQSFEILNGSNMIIDLHSTTYFYAYDAIETSNQSLPATWIRYDYTYISYNPNIQNYMQTLWDYSNISIASLRADDPYNYKQQLVNQMNINGENTIESESQTTFVEDQGYSMGTGLYSQNPTITNNNKLYVLTLTELSKKYENIDYEITPSYPLIYWDPQYGNMPITSNRYQAWAIAPVKYEVINIPDVMFTIVSMPFTFISRAFNLTLFPNTPYAVNIGNIFLSIIAILTFIFVLKILLKMKG